LPQGLVERRLRIIVIDLFDGALDLQESIRVVGSAIDKATRGSR
jgi:hypothetical protein